MSDAALKQSLLRIVRGLAERGMGPFEAWARSSSVTLEGAKRMQRPDLRRAFLLAYGGENVVRALASAGLNKLLIQDLRHVIGAQQADLLVREFVKTDAENPPRPSSSPSPSPQRTSTKPSWTPPIHVIRVAGIIAVVGAGAFLFAFAYYVLMIVGLIVLFGGLAAAFSRQFRTAGLTTFVVGFVLIGLAGAIEPKPAKSVEVVDAEYNSPSSSDSSTSSQRPYTPTREEQCGSAGRWAARMVDGKESADNQYRNLESIGYC